MMEEPFVYEWKELTKAKRITPKLILQAALLAVIVGFVPDLVMYLAGYSDVYVYQFRFMLVAVPVVVIISVMSYRSNPASDVTTSTLIIDRDIVKVTRHVIAQTGRRFFVEWCSLEIKEVKADELHRIIQFDARWKASAYKEKRGMAAGYVDADEREHPQTFQLAPEKYYKAVRYLKEWGYVVKHMTTKEYKDARPFIHKHYEL